MNKILRQRTPQLSNYQGIYPHSIDKSLANFLKINPFAKCKSPTNQHISNPQFISKSFTFHKQVLSCVLNPNLMGTSAISYDASKKAETYLKQIISAGSYSISLGIPSVKTNIARHIAQSCSIMQPSIDDIYLMQGVSQAFKMIMKCLIVDKRDSIMLPVPTQPLYLDIIGLVGGNCSPYFLDEDNDWQVDREELERSYAEAKKQGKKIKALVIINPGNATGSIFSWKSLEHMIAFAHLHKLLIIVDETNSNYIHSPLTRPIVPILSVIRQQSYLKQLQVISFDSISKTVFGEMGLHAGSVHCHNVSPEVKKQFDKIWNLHSCNVPGQLMLDMVRKPFLQDVTNEVAIQYQKEKFQLRTYLERRVDLIQQAFQGMKNIKLGTIMAGNHAYAKLSLPQKAIEKANTLNLSADEFFCNQVQKAIDMKLQPGTSFGQKSETHQFRMNILDCTSEQLSNKLSELKKFNQKFHEKFLAKKTLRMPTQSQ